jgi:hypothetical protein
MASRKLDFLTLVLACLLVALPLAADDGAFDFWGDLIRKVAAIFSGGEETTAADPSGTTAPPDDPEIHMGMPVGG